MTFAFIFESIGGTEWLVLLGVVLIVVGPKNLPAAARKMGQIMSTLRRAADEFKRQVMAMDQEVSKAVNDVAADSTKSSETTSSTEGSDASSGSDNGEDLYGDDNPYPGYEEYYDETQYDGSAEDGGEESSESPADAKATDGAAETKHVPTDAELRAIKITVTTDASAKKGAKA